MSLQMLRQSVKGTRLAASSTLARAISTSGPTYTETQARLGRPVSPSVTIYKFPVSALSSIANRVSAVGLTGGLAAGSAIAAIGGDVPSIIYACQDIIPGFAPISKFIVAFPLSYHLLAAARHAAWDVNPELINNTQGPQSSQALFGAAAVFSLGAAAYTIKSPAKKEE
ncbi:TPA: hypothetical protein N0F65_008513 [Lagenidium giganteum]|uniref:Uncharacterized protein n=1 Tax=Lagenidium giganteum TaxID=4803 RepID=A0AAV2Z4Z1_9STRA|nr:TPA: hypothetical protein N0F65_008513 [Lagenidium giganteum]